MFETTTQFEIGTLETISFLPSNDRFLQELVRLSKSKYINTMEKAFIKNRNFVLYCLFKMKIKQQTTTISEL